MPNMWGNENTKADTRSRESNSRPHSCEADDYRTTIDTTILFKKPFEHIIGKGEYAVNQQFPLSHDVFDPIKDKNNSFS